MALAFGTFHELSHQLRFLLFEIGIGLPAATLDYFITLAHRDALKKLQNAAINEGLVANYLSSHHVHDYLDQLQRQLQQGGTESHFYQWDALRNEVDESIANDALAQAYKLHWNNQLKMEASAYPSLWAWLQHQSGDDVLSFLEQWGDIQHPTHHAYKARIGFSRREVLQNAPEFQARFSLHWCALNKNYSATGSTNFTGFLAQQFPKEFSDWRSKLLFMHMNPDHYDPLPIHPWHWRNRIQKHYTSLLDSKSLVLLPHHQLCKPSMSEHIIIPDGRSKTLIRTSIVAEESSPTLNTILAKTDHYYQSLFISTRLAVVQAIHEPIMKPGVLAADFLQNPSLLIKENQFILPLPALFTVSPLTNKPLLIEIIATSSQRPEVYFREHCYKILFSQLHLLLKHGLALDVQTKDALLIIDNYKTRALVVRQFHLAKNEPKELHPEKSKELARVIIRTNLQNNINYWINILNQEYQLAPKLLWGIVREVISSLFATFSGEIDTTTLEFYRNCLLNQPWHYPSPVTTCLQGNRQRERYFQSASPLNP